MSDERRHFINEGARARRSNKPITACPYRMSGVLTGGAVLRATLQAATWWKQGWQDTDDAIRAAHAKAVRAAAAKRRRA